MVRHAIIVSAPRRLVARDARITVSESSSKVRNLTTHCLRCHAASTEFRVSSEVLFEMRFRDKHDGGSSVDEEVNRSYKSLPQHDSNLVESTWLMPANVRRTVSTINMIQRFIS